MKRSRIRSRSTKRGPAFTAARQEAVALAFARDGGCQAQRVWPHDCWGPLVGHEPRKRSQGGDPTNVDEILIVCQFVNGRVEDEPEWAREHGLSVHGWESWTWAENWRAS